MEKLLRLDKYLSDMDIGSRSQVRTWIRKGRVNINSISCKKPDQKVRVNKDEVSFDGQIIIYEEFLYYMLNKPAGLVSATTDNRDKTVIDIIESTKSKELFPVGRLDKDTEGLLIISNDGELAHKLLSPKNKVDKVYYAKVNGRVTNEDVEAFLSGISIGEPKPCLPAKLEVLSSDDISQVYLTIQEGKFHQVKRMFKAVGKEVIYLKRVSMAGLDLDLLLKPGDYRRLTEDELEHLKKVTLQKKE